MDGPISLNYVAVKQIADLYEIELAPGVMDKIRMLEQMVLDSCKKGGK